MKKILFFLIFLFVYTDNSMARVAYPQEYIENPFEKITIPFDNRNNPYYKENKKQEVSKEIKLNNALQEKKFINNQDYTTIINNKDFNSAKNNIKKIVQEAKPYKRFYEEIDDEAEERQRQKDIAYYKNMEKIFYIFLIVMIILFVMPVITKGNEENEEYKKIFFIKRLWQGKYKLPVAFWGFGLFVFSVLNIIIDILLNENVFHAIINIAGNLATGFIYFSYLFLHLSYLMIAFVGIWRSANNYIGRSIWKYLSKIIISLWWINLFVEVLNIVIDLLIRYKK